jgi:hypothetical protein
MVCSFLVTLLLLCSTPKPQKAYVVCAGMVRLPTLVITMWAYSCSLQQGLSI